MTAPEQPGREAAALEQEAVRAERAGDPDTADDLFGQAQQARFGTGGE